MKREPKRIRSKKQAYLSDKKSWFLFILQIQFLILSFVLILWGQRKLKAFSQKQAPAVERKAEFIAPQRDLKDLKEP